jgi:hypothetical protein
MLIQASRFKYFGSIMKPLQFAFLVLLMGWIVGLSAPSQAGMKARLADEAWNGEIIPDGQQCSRHGGAGSTPTLEISGIPTNTDEITIAINDESFPLMNNGGHGVLGFVIDNEGFVTLPPIQGETNDLPEGVRSIAAHKATAEGYSPGTAYLPPCSGGMGNRYSVTITALKRTSNGRARLLDQIKIPLGRY